MRTILSIALLLTVAACAAGRGDEAGGNKANRPTADKDIVRLLPQAPDVRPWTLTDRRLSYDAATLSDYIDGAAETYRDYGFVRVVSQEYASGAESLVCSVYEMRDPEAAFGIFSSTRSPAKQPLAIGDDGFRAEAQLGFWQARYYVTVEAYSLHGPADRALERFARAISARIGGHSGLPQIMSQLPRRDLRPSTDRLLKGRSAADALAAVAAAPASSLVGAGSVVLAGDYETAAGSYRLLVVLAANAGEIDRVRTLPARLFTAAAGYVPASTTGRRAADTRVWMRQGRAFAAQPIDGGVRLVVDATRPEDARAAVVGESSYRSREKVR